MVSRRQVLGGVVGSVAGGVPAMRPDQALQPLSRAGTGPAPQNQFLVNPVIIITPGRAILIYSPVPGANNLIQSISAAGGTDRYGNVYLADDTSYAFTGAAYVATQKTGNGLVFWTSLTEAGPWTEQAGFQNAAFPGFGSNQVNLSGLLSVSNLGGSFHGGTVWIPPSGDTTGAQDRAAITAAWSAGWDVKLTSGTYYINQPLAPPDNATLIGAGCAVNNSLRQAATTINCVAAFTGAGAILQTTVAATPIGNFTIRGIHFDLTAAPTTTDGFHAFSNIYGNTIEDVSMLGPGGAGTGIGLNLLFDGVSGLPDGWRVNGLLIMAMGNGVFAQAADMIWNDIHVIQSVGDGFRIRTLANSLLSNCRAANGGGNGWNMGDSATGGAGPSASIQMDNCNSQLNQSDGLHIQWPSSGGQLLEVTNFTSINDGQSGAATTAGVNVTGGGTTGFTDITGLIVSSNSTGPLNGIYCNSAAINDSFVNGKLQIAAAGGNTVNNLSSNIFSNRALFGKLGVAAWAAIADSA